MPHVSSQQSRFLRTITSVVLCTLIWVGFLSAYPTNGYAFEATEEEMDYTVQYVYKLLDKFGYDPKFPEELIKKKFKAEEVYPGQSEFVGTWLELYSWFQKLDEISDALADGNYYKAAYESVEKGVATAFGYAFGSAGSLSMIGVSMAGYSVNVFKDVAIQTAYNRQVELYCYARMHGYSHEFIMDANPGLEDLVVFTDDGWLYIVEDKHIPVLAVRPGNFSRDEVYEYAQRVYEFQQADYTAEQETSIKRLLASIGPTISFSPDSIMAPENVTFQVTGSALDDMNIVSYAWNFGDGTTGSGQTVTHFYTQAKGYDVKLTMTDNAGELHEVTKRVVVQPPQIDLTRPDFTNLLRFQFSTPVSPYATKYTWYFGDNTPGVEGRVLEHTYTTRGTYFASSTLKLANGKTCSAQQEVFAGVGPYHIEGPVTIYDTESGGGLNPLIDDR